MRGVWFLVGVRYVLIIELVSRTAGHTETDAAVVVAVRAEFVAAVGNSRAFGVLAPATATDAADGGTGQIEAPLPHISAHVINF